MGSVLSSTHTRTSSQRLARKEEVRTLLARRHTPNQIADKLSIKPQTVAYWIEQIRQDAIAAAADRAAEIRTTLESLAEVEREAWAAWDRSKEPGVTEKEEDGSSVNGPFSKSVKTTQYQVGDPAYLQLVLGCQAQRRQLLGLDAPSKAQEIIAAELSAGLERLRVNLPATLFQHVAGLLAGEPRGELPERPGEQAVIDVGE